MSRLKALSLLLSALLLAACAPHVLVEQDPNVHLPGAGSYAWGIAMDRIPGDQNPRVNNDIIATQVQHAIDHGLAKRGYRLMAKADAAWLVHYHIGLEKQTMVITEPVFPAAPRVVCGAYRCGTMYGWGFYGPPEAFTRTVTFHEGTLLVDIHDAKTNKLVWRGTLSDEINVNKPLNEEKLQAAITRLLEKLPAAQP